MIYHNSIKDNLLFYEYFFLILQYELTLTEKYVLKNTAAKYKKENHMNKKFFTKQEMASFIDHTLLKPEATQKDILKLCEEAKYYKFASVCVNPYWVSFVSEQLKNTEIKTCSVISFPLGSEPSELKAQEAAYVIAHGAGEVDMVINIGAVKDQNWTVVEKDIQAVVNRKQDALIKVIIETCLLTEEEIVKTCIIAREAGADFVKTSTGFSKKGAIVSDVALMRKTVGSDLGVKASGGIRTLQDAEKMLAAGASRLGTSAGKEIIKEMETGEV